MGVEVIWVLVIQFLVFCQKLSDGWYQVWIVGWDVSMFGLMVQLYEILFDGVVIYIVFRVVGVKLGGVFQIVLGVVVIVGLFFIVGVIFVVWGVVIGVGGMIGILFFFGVSMVFGGVVQMLAPKVRTFCIQIMDNGKQNIYFFLLDNMVVQGNVLFVLYGEMCVGLCVVFQEISMVDEGDGGQVVVIGC